MEHMGTRVWVGWLLAVAVAVVAGCAAGNNQKEAGDTTAHLYKPSSIDEVARLAPAEQIRYFTDNVYLAAVDRNDSRAAAATAALRHLQDSLSKEEFVRFWTGVDSEFFGRVNAVLEYPDYTHRQVTLDQRRTRTAYNLGARHLAGIEGAGQARQLAMRDLIEFAAKGDSAACFAFHKAYKDYPKPRGGTGPHRLAERLAVHLRPAELLRSAARLGIVLVGLVKGKAGRAVALGRELDEIPHRELARLTRAFDAVEMTGTEIIGRAGAALVQRDLAVRIIRILQHGIHSAEEFAVHTRPKAHELFFAQAVLQMAQGRGCGCRAAIVAVDGSQIDVVGEIANLLCRGEPCHFVDTGRLIEVSGGIAGLLLIVAGGTPRHHRDRDRQQPSHPHPCSHMLHVSSSAPTRR